MIQMTTAKPSLARRCAIRGTDAARGAGDDRGSADFIGHFLPLWPFMMRAHIDALPMLVSRLRDGLVWRFPGQGTIPARQSCPSSPTGSRWRLYDAGFSWD